MPWIFSSVWCGASTRHRIVPVVLSRQSVSKCSLSRTAVRKILSLTITGEECPGGSAASQSTVFSGPISAGNGASGCATPPARGPRNCGQSAAEETGEQHKNKENATKIKRGIAWGGRTGEGKHEGSTSTTVGEDRGGR